MTENATTICASIIVAAFRRPIGDRKTLAPLAALGYHNESVTIQRKSLNSAPSSVSDLQEVELGSGSSTPAGAPPSVHNHNSNRRTSSSSSSTSPPSAPVQVQSRKSVSLHPDIPRSPDSLKKTVLDSKRFSLSKFFSPSSMQPQRSESMAYPISNTSTVLSKAQFVCRKHTKPILATIAFAMLLLLVTLQAVSDTAAGGSKRAPLFRGRNKGLSVGATSSDIHWGGSVQEGYFYPQDAVKSPTEFRFAAVTDLDELSKINDNPNKPKFYSTFLGGTLTKTPKGRYEMVLDTDHTRQLITKHNEAGRGAEFSELTIYQNRLLTFDDRTGDVFEILNDENGENSIVVPRFIITEGNGETEKGMKWEWSTVKDGELYMGSMGKEYTLQDGSVKNRNNLWIGVLNEYGQLRRENWEKQYNVVRHALGADFPGYIIIEACNWSPILHKWVFLPRRISKTAYDEVEDEKKGGHQLVLVSEDFKDTTVVDIKMKSLDPLKGFSTFAFVPNSDDRHVLAIRSVEDNCVDFTPQCQQHSYFIVFDIMTGEVLSDEIKYPENVKYEGIEFVDMSAKPPITKQK